MPTITLKNIPNDLYQKLKMRARLHRRSINSEILYCLEQLLTPHPIDESEILTDARKMRKKTGISLTDRTLQSLKNDGRP
ncbi:MAG: Arc family DNA-binding protein [Calditrichaeota bacterium]|nr:Arc family DNA-binding protein [Calditrichota bacterium]